MKFRKLALCMLTGIFMINLSNINTYAAEETAATQVQESLIEIGFAKQDTFKQILEAAAKQEETKDIESKSLSLLSDKIEETSAIEESEGIVSAVEQEQATKEDVSEAEQATNEVADQQEKGSKTEVAEEEQKEEQKAEEKDKSEKAVAVSEKKQTSKEAATKYTKAELRLLSALIYCEAGGESYNGKLAVGIVVMNRVRSGKFPDTMKDVIYQKYQFSPVRNGTLKRALSEYDNGRFTSNMEKECIKAAKAALSGTRTINIKGEKKNFSKYLYFSGRLRGYTYKLGNHRFK